MYRDIGEYGVVGGPRTTALVSRDGSIEWCCLPFFHSPAAFAALLDHDSGGRFGVSLVDATPRRQRYEPGTNVLRTTIESPEGSVRITDFMPYYLDQGELIDRDEILRSVECLDGQPTVRVRFDPRLDFARGETTVEPLDDGYRASNGAEALTLASAVDLETSASGASGECEVREGDELWFACRYGDVDPSELLEDPSSTLERTRRYWKAWSDRCEYDGPWREEVLRSALTLKLLAYDPTGAVVAAATTSLPEITGGTRNWDYRYTWIRDSMFSAWSFHLLDYHELGIDFIDLLERKLDPTDIPPIVDIQGDPVPREEELDHLEGYRNSQPVRIGNAAAEQLQWGSYGAMIDGIYFVNRKMGGIDKEVYEGFVKPTVEYVSEEWERPDHGIWEVRGGKRQFVTSKMWCWVVLDRGIKTATWNGYEADADRWRPVRDEIEETILERGWSDELGAFKMAFDEAALDASALLMPLVGFLPARHPKMEATIDAITDELAVDSLLYRYRPEAVESDPIPVGDSAFTTCSFWLVACLVRLGRTEEARELFEALLEYSNHLGLYAEELDPETGAQLGNFPQAYVHMGLINAAVELNRVLG